MQPLGGEPLEGHNLYEKVRTIGKGQRSFVQVAKNKVTGELVAIRFIPRGWEPSHTKYVAREILNHQELSLSKHPHVVEFKEVFLTPRYLAEVLEYVEGETLQNFLNKVGGKVIEGLARFIFQQLVIALDFCHRKGKVNRDIKLSNILLSIVEGQLPLVKLADFGFSKDTYRHSEPHSQVGTALFVAPEVMQNFSGGRYDGQAADMWACGVCLFIMLFGRHPYLRATDNNLNEQQQMIKLFQRMMQNEIEFPAEVMPSLSPECIDLLKRMLKTDPNARSTMADIQRHPWFATALPDGAGLMNDLFLAEDAVSLSQQTQSQIEQLVALAARLDGDGSGPIRVQLPSAVAATASAGGALGRPPGSGAAQARVTAPSALPGMQHALGARTGSAQMRNASSGGLSSGGAGNWGVPAPPPVASVPQGRVLGAPQPPPIVQPPPAVQAYPTASSPQYPPAPAPSPATSMQASMQAQARVSSGAVTSPPQPSGSVGTPHYGGGSMFPGASTATSSGGYPGAGLAKPNQQLQSQQAQQQQFLREFRASMAAQQAIGSGQQQGLHHPPPPQQQYHHPGSRPTLPPAPPPGSGVTSGPSLAYSPGTSTGGMPVPPQPNHGDYGGPTSGSLGGAVAVPPMNAMDLGLGLSGMDEDMIPDLDAMVMNMPETELLAAATVDLRQPQAPASLQHRSSHSSMPPPSGGPAPMQPGINPMQPFAGYEHQHLKQQQAQQAAQQQQQAQQHSMGPPQRGMSGAMPHHGHMVPGPSGVMARAPGSMSSGGGSSVTMRGPSFAQNLYRPPTELERQMMAGQLPQASMGGAPGVVDASPFLYEGNDDDLPLIGSLSAFNPGFDWEAFNQSFPHDGNLQQSQRYQSSYFNQISQVVSAKMSDTQQQQQQQMQQQQRQGSMGTSQLQAQMAAMGGLGGGAGSPQQQQQQQGALYGGNSLGGPLPDMLE